MSDHRQLFRYLNTILGEFLDDKPNDQDYCPLFHALDLTATAIQEIPAPPEGDDRPTRTVAIMENVTYTIEVPIGEDPEDWWTEHGHPIRDFCSVDDRECQEITECAVCQRSGGTITAVNADGDPVCEDCDTSQPHPTHIEHLAELLRQAAMRPDPDDSACATHLGVPAIPDFDQVHSRLRKLVEGLDTIDSRLQFSDDCLDEATVLARRYFQHAESLTR